MELPKQHAEHGKDEKFFTVGRVLTGLGIASAASVILAPYVLPAFGMGTPTLSKEAAIMLGHNKVARGWSGALNGVLGGVPVIGKELAEGGIFTSLVSGIVGLGSIMLSNYVAKGEHDENAFKWSKVIKYAGLATSVLIALPTVMTSLGTGIIYLAMLAKTSGFLTAAGTSSIIGMVSKTLGNIGGVGQHAIMGLGGIAAAIPHLLTCGIPFLPMALSGNLLKSDAHSHSRAPSGEGVSVEAVLEALPEAGKPCTMKVMLRNEETGQLLTSDDLAITHTKQLHMLVVDQSLRDYHHVHPQPTDQPGVFTMTFTPTTNNSYTAWADFTTAHDGQTHRIPAEIPSSANRSVPASVVIGDHTEKAGLQCDWQSNSPLQKGKETLVHIDVKDANGEPVKDLEPVMGAYAHLVGFSADGKTLIHAHPMGDEPATPEDRGGPRLTFHVSPESEGNVQFYLQLQRGGQEVMVPFGQRIKPPAAAVDKEVAARHSHSHAHAGHSM